MIDYPKQLNKIFDALYKHNAKAILVGGYVRDKLLNIDSKDIDIEVYGISSFSNLEAILQNFGNVNSVGKSFGVCKLHFDNYDLDFSLPRRDSKTSSGHRGFDIKVDPNLDFKTAASRRDFTINAIGYDTKEKKLLDPFKGLDDLKNKTLCMVDKKSFTDDPLRVLRAVQFSARFEFEIDTELFELCKKMVKDRMLDELPKERIFEELKKLFLKSKRPSLGFELLKKLGTDIYTKNIHVIDSIILTNDADTDIVLMLAALCYDFNEAQITDFILRFTDKKELLSRVITLTDTYKEIDSIFSQGVSDYSVYKLATTANIKELLILSRAIYFSHNKTQRYEAADVIEKKAKELNVLEKKLQPILQGKDILGYNLEPSSKFSVILKDAYESQMRGDFNDHKGARVWLKNYLQTRHLID